MSIKYEDIEYLTTLSQKENQELCGWYRHLTLVLATILGVTVSLGNTNNESLLSHYCFALAIVLLSMSIGAAFALLYLYSAYSGRKLKASYLDELDKARGNDNPYRPKGAGVNLPKWVKPLEIVCHALASVGLLLFGISAF